MDFELATVSGLFIFGVVSTLGSTLTAPSSLLAFILFYLPTYLAEL
jgi:hypothetical protein